MTYLITTIIVIFPSLGFVWRWQLRTSQNDDEKQCEQYLFYCFMIPLLIFVVVAMFKNCWLPAAYGAPLWTFLGVWLLLRFRLKELPNTIFSTIKLTILMECVMIILLIGGVLSPYVDGKGKKQLFATKEFGVKCDQIWHSRFDVPCRYVTGDWSLCGYACYAMRDRPSLHFYWNIYDGGIGDMEAKPTGTWSTDEDVNQKGGIIVWNISDVGESDNSDDSQKVPDWVYRRFPKAEIISEPIILPYKTGAKVPPAKIGVAIIPPQN
jgi:hypothetical protein